MPPVGIKFCYSKPDGIERIDKKIYICEMLAEAHKVKSFYAQKEDIDCVGSLYLGMQDLPHFEAGLEGPPMGLYKERRANEKLYRLIARIPKGNVNYVAFSTLDKLSFDPDVFIITTDNLQQADILMRATVYTNGGIWCGRASVGAGCNFVYVYPYISGEVNFTVSGLGFLGGDSGVPDSHIIVSIPYNLLPNVIDNLHEIEWYRSKEYGV